MAPADFHQLFTPAERASLRGAWPLDYAVAHLNHGSFGACPREVLDAQTAWRTRMQANPVRFYRQVAWPAVDEALRRVAEFLDADPDGLAFVDNATTAATTVLGSVPLAAGDEILLTDHTYGAVRMAAERFAADAGARLVSVTVPLLAVGDEVVARVLGAVTRRTRLVVVDQVTSPTARQFPVAELASALHQRDIPVAVDAAHAPGMLDVAVRAIGADFWFGNLHKWVCGPTGAGVLAVAERWRGRMRAPIVSWNDNDPYPMPLHQRGTRDLTPWLAAPAALDFHARLGWDRVRAYGRGLAAEAVGRVTAALGIDPASAPSEDLPMRTVPLPERLGHTHDDATRLRSVLSDAYATEGVVTCWNDRLLLRLSAHLYNESADYDRLLEALTASDGHAPADVRREPLRSHA